MTDRHTGYVVILDQNMRQDDSADLITAISLMRGVADVKPIVSEPAAERLAVQRRDLEWRRALMDLSPDGHQR